MTEKQITHYIGDSCEGGHYETPETPAMTNQTPADALDAIAWEKFPLCAGGCQCRAPNDGDANECGCDGGCCTEEWFVERTALLDAIRQAQDVAARYAREKALAEADKYMEHLSRCSWNTSSICDCGLGVLVPNERAALAEAQEQSP